MDNGGVSPGEVGGVTAGILMVGQVVLRFLRWVAGWYERRLKTEAARLADWQGSLDRREREQRTHMEAEMGELRADLEAQGRQLADQTAINQLTRMAMVEMAAELERHAPDSLALRRAHALLHTTAPVGLFIPAGMATMAHEIDERKSS